MEPKIIKTDREYRQFLARIETLMEIESPDRKTLDELELLAALVEMYEQKKWPIDPPSPVDAIRFRMEQQGLTPNDLIPYFGSKSKVSEVMSGKRSLSKEMIRKLHEGLHIPLESLVYEREPMKVSEPPAKWQSEPQSR